MPERITQANHYGKTGGPAHQSLIGQVAAGSEKFNVQARREYSVFDEDKYVGALDLLLSNGHTRVAAEVALSADRVLHDRTKARLAGVDQLVICVPNARVRRAVCRKLARYSAVTDTPPWFVLTLSQTLQHLTATFATAKRTESHVLGDEMGVSSGNRKRCVRARSKG